MKFLFLRICNEYKLENIISGCIHDKLCYCWLRLVSVESAGPDPLWLLGPGGDLRGLDCVRVVSVVVSTLGHLVRAGALPVNTRPGP